MILEFARAIDAAVLLIHHLRKTSGTENLDVRGSGALNAQVDVSVAYRRLGEGSARLLEAILRYSETPDQLVVELSNEGFRPARPGG